MVRSLLKSDNYLELNLDRLSDVIIYPYFECNLRCKNCLVNPPKSEEVGFLKCSPLDFIEHIEPYQIERMLSWRVKNWVILGGEPFLSNYTPVMLSKLSGNGRVIVYTNATLIYEHLKEHGFDSLLEDVLNHIDRLIISLEGGRDWTEYIRGKGVYDKVHYVLDRIVDKVDVVVRMGYFEDNLQSVLGEIQRLNEEKIPVILFPRIDHPPLDVNTMYYFYNAVASFDMADILLPSYKNFLGLNPEGVSCPAGWAKVCVLPDGYLIPCQWNFVKIAHLDWRDEDIEYAFTKWCQHAFKLRPECIGCKYAYRCRGSCRVARDYLECPVRYGGKLVDNIVNVLGEVREVNRSKVIARMKKIEGLIVHGCSAGC